jgi:putative heme-binding domain-containing protein
LAFNSYQLNKEHRYAAARPPDNSGPAHPGSAPARSGAGERPDNQLRALEHIGVLHQSLFAGPMLKLADPSDGGADMQQRARSWLHVNCAHCHRYGAGGSVASFFNYDQKFEESRIVNYPPSQGTFGIPAAHVVTPGDPLRSVLYYRISSLGPAHMPRIGSRVISVAGLNLVYDWIRQMPQAPGTNDVGLAEAAKIEESIPTLLGELRANRISSAQEPRIDRLLGSTVGALALLREINLNSLNPNLRQEIIERGIAYPNPLVRDLFERFVPEEKRVQRLGPDIKPEDILALKGDASRGETVFFVEGGVQCFQCHRINGRGREFGPELSHIGQKYTRAQLLDSILNPSKLIDPAFASWQVETKDDLNYSGLVVRRTVDEVVLKDASLNEIRLKPADVKAMEASKVSAMPEGLLQALTGQEAADLLEFLSSLR